MSSSQDCMTPRHGKHRAKVISTEDPTMSGKLLCEVPSLPGMLLNWATPAVPYAGIEQGMFALPEEGSDVWIEFEQGNPDNPIWSGGYWEEGLEPVMPELSPEAPELVNVLRSKYCSLIMNDTPAVGGVTLSVTPPAVDVAVTLTMSSAGFTVTVGAHSITINAEAGITLTSAESLMKLNPEGQTTDAPSIELLADDEVSVTAPATTVTSDTTTISEVLLVEGPATLQQATVETELEVTGPSTLIGGATVTEELTVTGETTLVGAVTATGETSLVGNASIEGDLEVLAAILAPTAETVAAVAEVAIVP